MLRDNYVPHCAQCYKPLGRRDPVGERAFILLRSAPRTWRICL